MTYPSKPERNAAIVLATRRGALQAESASRFGVSRGRVGQLVRKFAHVPTDELEAAAGRYARPAAITAPPIQMTWPDGTAMNELQVRLLRIFAELPKGHWMTRDELDALLTLVSALIREYYDTSSDQAGAA
jgi:transposase